MAQSQWTNSCCNPFEQSNNSCKRKRLGPVAKWTCPSISVGSKICDACRKKLAKVPTTLSSASEIEQESEVYVDIPESLASINQCLGKMGETPVSKTKLQQTNYPKQKIKKITTAMKKVMIHDAPTDETDDEGEIMKEKFHTTTKRSEKVQVLTVLPKSWPVRFSVSFVHSIIWPEK